MLMGFGGFPGEDSTGMVFRNSPVPKPKQYALVVYDKKDPAW